MQQQQKQQGSDYAAAAAPSPAPEMLSFGGSRMLDEGGGGGGGSEQAEAASPISSRPPAAAGSSINFDELVDHDQSSIQGGSSGGSGGGNRWPRQETLALLKIRSEMDVAFRDATLKAPLWDEVSRKLAELGYVRSAKKCKEKFENVHKYYKRTKEGRAGRQDGKTYRFFTQLEAMQGQPPPPATAGGSANLLLPPPTTGQQQVVMSSGPPAATTVASASVGNIQFAAPVSAAGSGRVFQPFTMYSAAGVSTSLPASAVPPVGISFSSDSASSDSDDEVDDELMSEEEEEEEEEELDEDRPASSSQKRKRSSGSGSGSNKRSRMMDFFERLMKKVMQKQEAMQQKFLETIEKREQDRLMREEAWKQHEAARLNREQQLASQERALAASRDAAIVSFLHKITGQTIQLPPPPPPQPQAQPVYTTASSAVHHVALAPIPASAPLQARQQQPIQPQNYTELIIRQQQITSQMPPPAVPPPARNNEVIMAVPERQIPPQAAGQGEESSSSEPASSSRWPKVEVLALIKLRSNLENRYQEAGPKGPLWEEISAGMQRMGYNRSSKRCKEKWENINKYFKKVKESNKKRPEDAKTCPYFNELDALYQRKKLGSSSSSGGVMVQFQQQQQQQDAITPALPPMTSSIVPGSVVQQQASVVLTAHVEPVTERAPEGSNDQVQQPTNAGLPDDNLIGGQVSNIGGSRKPEDIRMEQKQLNLKEDYNQQQMDDELGDNSAEVQDEDDEDESEDERKMGYKIDQFQRPPTNNKNGGTSSSFNITMVQ